MGHFAHQLIHLALGAQQPLGVQLHVGGLPARAAAGLVNHHFAVGQRKAHPGFARHQQKRAHRGGHAEADGANLRLDVAHRVKDGHAVGHASARAVDVHGDIGVRVFHFQKEQLGDNAVGQRLVHLAAQKNHAILQQAGVNVIRTFAVRRLFNDAGFKVIVVVGHHGRLLNRRLFLNFLFRLYMRQSDFTRETGVGSITRPWRCRRGTSRPCRGSRRP